MPAGSRTNLWADWTNRAPEVTVGSGNEVAVRIEVEAVGAIAFGRAERTRPVVTRSVGTNNEVAGRKEDGVAVRAVHLIAVHAVLRGPGPGAFVDQFLEFINGRHAPRRAELLCSGVVGRDEGGLVVADEGTGGVIPDAPGLAVGDGVFRDVLRFGLTGLHPLVGRPSVFRLRIGLAPGVVVARLGRLRRAEVALGPLQAARKAEVHIFDRGRGRAASADAALELLELLDDLREGRGGAGVAAVHFVDEVVDGVGHAGYLRGDGGLAGAESLGLVLDRIEGRHDGGELVAVVRHSLDGGLDGGELVAVVRQVGDGRADGFEL